MGLEQKINYQLNKYPGIKKYIKRAYQLTMYAISPKITLYSSSQIAYTVEQIANFRNTIGLIIDEYLNNSRLSMTELRNTIVTALGGDIVGAKISGIDTNDSEIVVVNDKINRLTLAKRLNINDFNEFEVIYDVDVVIQYV